MRSLLARLVPPRPLQSADKNKVGCIIGLIINGYITEWFGYKKTMVISMLVMTGAIFIPFFSTSLEMFLVGGIIQGLPWGVFQTLAISYAA
jgi:SP family general alpha glucoside:H+ symporter-like MFS transporter